MALLLKLRPQNLPPIRRLSSSSNLRPPPPLPPLKEADKLAAAAAYKRWLADMMCSIPTVTSSSPTLSAPSPSRGQPSGARADTTALGRTGAGIGKEHLPGPKLGRETAESTTPSATAAAESTTPSAATTASPNTPISPLFSAPEVLEWLANYKCSGSKIPEDPKLLKWRELRKTFRRSNNNDKSRAQRMAAGIGTEHLPGASKKDNKADGVARTEFLKTYNFEELGQKRESEDKETEPKKERDLQFKKLQDFFLRLKEAEYNKKSSTQRMAILTNPCKLETPTINLKPAHEELLENDFHPVHMSSAEKRKFSAEKRMLELQKVIDEFTMSELDSGPTRFQEKRGPVKNRRRWTEIEDTQLIEALLELVNAGIYQADNGFKSRFASAIEIALNKKLPGAGIRAKPHIESRIKTMKKNYNTICDMLNTS